jgi:4-diphosphocytidyl-2-C-methyl-D-erythritol kinase
MISFPNAKINIGLNVVEKRTDGYHNLETIFYPVKLADALEIVEAQKTELSASGIEVIIDPENNLILKAYRLLKSDFNLPELRFHLHKTIPHGAGLGGGSADAAFTLKMLNKRYSLNLTSAELETYAAKLGADCAFFIRNQTTFAHGIGDRFESIDLDLSAYNIVIVKPNVSVSTVEAYQNVVPRKAEFDLRGLGKLSIEKWRETIHNDFEKSVFPGYPQIHDLKKKLYDLGAIYASMSGSGSAVFGIFRHLPIDLANYLPKGIFIYR